jgi:hypothetical protein
MNRQLSAWRGKGEGFGAFARLISSILFPVFPAAHFHRKEKIMKADIIICTFGLAIFNLSTAMVQAGDYVYETSNGTITITGYTGPGGDVMIPSTIDELPVASIGDWAFSGGTNLTSVTIGTGVTSIGRCPFNGCTSLTEITVDALNPVYKSVDGVLFSRGQATLIQYPAGKTGSYTIPNGVTSIGEFAFAYTAPTEVAFPNTVISIEWGAFFFSSVSSVSIGENVSVIHAGAFFACQKLSSITIPNSVTTIAGGILPGAFQSCTSLTNVMMGKGLTVIGHEAFKDCTNLTALYFKGSAPSLDGTDFFEGDGNAIVYYLPGTTGWSDNYAERPTAPWVLPYPVILTSAPNFGIQTNWFGLRISWAANASVVVEASTRLGNSTWLPVGTNVLVNGWSDFSDVDWTKYSTRFYRIRSL